MIKAYLQFKGTSCHSNRQSTNPIVASIFFRFVTHKSLEVRSIPAEVSYLARFGLVEDERRAGLFWVVC